MALVFMDRQGKEIYPYYRRMTIPQEQGADESAGSYSGQSPLVHSLSLGYSTCLLINTVHSLNSSIIVVSPFFIPWCSISLSLSLSLGVLSAKGASVSGKP